MIRNLCELLQAACNRGRDRIALRWRNETGAWCELSWTDYELIVESAAAGLIEQGVAVGDRVALHSRNRVEWLLADHAILASGAITVPLHATLSRSQVEFQLQHSGSRWLFTDDETVTPGEITRAFSLGGSGDGSWTSLVEQGSTADDEVHAECERRVAAIGPDDPATIIYTSGTTGEPKGVVLSHGNLVSNAVATEASSVFSADDVLLSWLPYSHVYARTVDHYLATHVGMTVVLAGSAETVVNDLREVAPTWLTAVPRLYEKVWNSVKSLDDESRAAALRGVFGPNIRQLSSGGAPLPVDVCRGYHAAGLPLFEGYGLTESSPVIAFNGLNASRIGSVGRPLPGIEVRIADDGEILTRGPHVMQGYWRNPVATRATIVDGWLRTGDLGHVDDGFLFVTGRKKELIVLSNGKNVAPTAVEAVLLRDPLVEQVVVFGDRRPCCVAIVVPVAERLAAECADLAIEPGTHSGVLEAGSLVDRLLDRFETLQQNLAKHERVRRVALLADPLTVEAGDLTASFKLRRTAIEERFADVLEKLYSD